MAMCSFSFQLAGRISSLGMVILLGLGGCNEAPHTTAAIKALPATGALQQVGLGQAAADSATQTAGRFFAWYQRHRAEANGFRFVASATDDDTTQSAGVCFPQVNGFLRLMRSSNCVSETYLKEWDEYFHWKADGLRNVSAGDEPVYGFDMELVLSSDDGDHYLKQMPRTPKKVRFTAANQAVVTADFAPGSTVPDTKIFHLRRYASGWLIDSIRAD